MAHRGVALGWKDHRSCQRAPDQRGTLRRCLRADPRQRAGLGKPADRRVSRAGSPAPGRVRPAAALKLDAHARPAVVRLTTLHHGERRRVPVQLRDVRLDILHHAVCPGSLGMEPSCRGAGNNALDRYHHADRASGRRPVGQDRRAASGGGGDGGPGGLALLARHRRNRGKQLCIAPARVHHRRPGHGPLIRPAFRHDHDRHARRATGRGVWRVQYGA